MILTDKHTSLIRHCLGLDGRNLVTYRNHFVIGPGCSDYDMWMELVNAGLAYRRSVNETSDDDIFWVTKSTARAVLDPGEQLAENFQREYLSKMDPGIPSEPIAGKFQCGHCGDNILVDFTYCPYCGREIDWLVSQVCRA